MEHFVTICDHVFLPQGLSLQRSMKRHFGSYRLWVICLDDETHGVLKRLDDPQMVPLRLSDLETDELRAVRAQRTRVEYCWTLTPWAPRFIFELDSTISRVTYVDADLWFRSEPSSIFAELERAGKAVLITEHAFAPEHDQSDIAGRFCVQFITFSRGSGEPVREWWEQKCMEWCSARAEPGRFGDQKYLDEWPHRFGELVHVLDDRELALAPWNVARFPFGRSIFYHFHGLRLVSKERAFLGHFALPQPVLRAVYRPYLADLRWAIGSIEGAGLTVRPQADAPSPLGQARRLWQRLSRALRHAMRQTDVGRIVRLP